MSPAKKSAVPVAEICLYGTTRTGSGWLACIADGTRSGRMLGDGEVAPGRSMTEAVWLAADELRAAGVTRGLVRIFEPDGLCADMEIWKHVPNFGELTWKSAPGYVISAEEIIAHAEVAQ